MAAQKETLISGNRPKAAVDEPTAAVSAIATSCDAQEQLHQVVDIRSSQETNNNNNNSSADCANDNFVEPQELKKPTKSSESSFISENSRQLEGESKERLSCLQSNEREKQHHNRQKNVDEDENGIENVDELTSSIQQANSAQSSRDNEICAAHRAELAEENTATQTGDKSSQHFETSATKTGTNKSSQQHTVVESNTKNNESNEKQVSENRKHLEVKSCASVEKTQLSRSNIEVTDSINENNQQTPTIESNNNNRILINNNNNKPHFVQKYKINKNPEPNKNSEDFPPSLNQTILTSNLTNHNTFIATKLDQTTLDDHNSREFGCKRRRLSYLQSLLLRKWPYLAIAICIMSSLLFGILLSALTVYLMHGVTDCSSYALAATRVNPLMVSQHERPLDFDSNTPIELASLTGHADLMGSSGSRLYAASGHLSGQSNSNEATNPAASATATTSSGHKFRRLPGTLWPVHYDLFVQPYIFEPHFNFTGKVSVTAVAYWRFIG